MKFAHLGDCHLGGWRQPELRELNFKSFQEALRRSIERKVNFILIAGDLFDSAYPPIDILKQTFDEFRKVKEAKIPVYLIAGSHDYSVSGKTFLDVLEKAGFCKNVSRFEERDGKIILQPTIFENVAIYGYPGKKSGMEVDEIERIKLQDAPGLFKILMLHTTIRDAIGNMPVKAVNEKELPKVDYLALAHLHIKYNKENRVYCGPTFPNNISELEELGCGSFQIFENGKSVREEIKIVDLLSVNLEVNDALTVTDRILDYLENEKIKDKIITIRLSGILEKGKVADIDFQKIENRLKEQGALAILKSTSKLHMEEPKIKVDFLGTENLENEIIRKFEERNTGKFNFLIQNLIGALQIKKLEDETTSTFEDRLLSETDKIIIE